MEYLLDKEFPVTKHSPGTNNFERFDAQQQR